MALQKTLRHLPLLVATAALVVAAFTSWQLVQLNARMEAWLQLAAAPSRGVTSAPRHTVLPAEPTDSATPPTSTSQFATDVSPYKPATPDAPPAAALPDAPVPRTTSQIRVQEILAVGSVTQQDLLELQADMATIPATERAQVMQQIAKAVNEGSVRIKR